MYPKIKNLTEKRFRNERDEMNIEIILKEDFLKELRIIVEAYEDIYQDNEVQEMFGKYKEMLSD